MPHVYVYLVPGFFGFDAMGGMSYFRLVKETLTASLKAQGIEARVIETHTRPTASITRRALALIDDVVLSGGLDADEIHFVGHSTGGLDVRLLVTPGVSLPGSEYGPTIAERTRSVTLVSTPNFGTPLANFFSTTQGGMMLQLISALATSRPGSMSVVWASQLLRFIARMDDLLGRKQTLLDSLSEQLFRHVTMRPDDPVWKFFRDVAQDQGAIVQLTPEGMALFDAAVTPRKDVSYACVLTAAPPPDLKFLMRHASAWDQAILGSIFSILHTISSREHKHYPYPTSLPNTLASSLPFEVTSKTNDGVIPTLSQIYGPILKVVLGDHLDIVGQFPVLKVVLGDHLDIVGQFPGAGGDAHADWLPSGSGFNQTRFDEAWRAIAQHIASAHAPQNPVSPFSVEPQANSR